MADTFTFATPQIIITLAQGYILSIGSFARNLEEIHIPFTDVTFLRNQGLQSAVIAAQGLETFPDLSSATTFKINIALMEGQDVVVEHERLRGPGGIPFECISTNRPGVNTNKTPGFHVIWQATFRVFPTTT